MSMSKEIEEYNKYKKIETWSKIYNGRYTSNDLLELIINERIDTTIRNREERENTKMMVSQLREIAEKLNRRY